MKFNVRSILVLVSLLTLQASVYAQDTTVAKTVEELRLQLIEVQTREQSLRIREQQLDEDLKPENIERALAGIGFGFRSSNFGLLAVSPAQRRHGSVYVFFEWPVNLI